MVFCSQHIYIKQTCVILSTSGNMIEYVSKIKTLICTVNSEKFASGLFSRNFTDAKFRENKTLSKRGNHSAVY